MNILSISWKYFSKHWIRYLLILIVSPLAVCIFIRSLRLFLTWYRATQHSRRDNELLLHIFLLTCACSPLACILGLIGGAIYYLAKFVKFGKYDVRMRRQGRGYWIDPSDAAEKTKEKHAAEMNKDLKGEAGPTPERVLPAPLPIKTAQHGHRMSMLNPLNWGSNNEHAPRDVEALPDYLGASTPSSSRTGYFSSLAYNPYRYTKAARLQTPRMQSVDETDDLPRLPAIRTSENDDVTAVGMARVRGTVSLKDRIKERAKQNARSGGNLGSFEEMDMVNRDNAATKKGWVASLW